MKKSCTVTLYKNNYGSVLQAYALQKTIEKMGYSNEIIKYKSNIFKEILKKVYFLKDFRHYKKYKNKRKMEKWTQKEICLSKTYFSYNKLKKEANKYEFAVCGSDQVWNNYKNRVNPINYLQFIKKYKRISYAPSIARESIHESIVEEVTKYINEICFLSVREEQAANLIKKHCNREARIVLDPTLLIAGEEWKEKIKNIEEYKEDYIFVYLLTYNQEYIEQIRKVAKNKKLKIVTVPVLDKKIDENEIVADPFEFLSLIRNSKYHC